MQEENLYMNFVYEYLYLHFFNREIYRGIYGSFLNNLHPDHSDVLMTALLTGCNPLVTSFSSYYETIDMMPVDNIFYKRLAEYGLIQVSGESQSRDQIIGHKQLIYRHNREDYAGYFDDDKIRKLVNIKPTILKPDVTENLEALFLGNKWKKIIAYAPSKRDANIVAGNKRVLAESVRNRGNKAITKFMFEETGNNKLAESTGRTLTGIYVDNYIQFINGDIITGIPDLKEYDFLGKHFPHHDYEILRELLRQFGFPCKFTSVEFDRIINEYNSKEHFTFALNIHKLLEYLYRSCDINENNFLVESKRLAMLTKIRSLFGWIEMKSIDFTSFNFYIQGIENVEKALTLIEREGNKSEKGIGTKMNSKRVFVVTGRDDELRLKIFSLLRALKLEPMEWMDVIKSTGKPSAYIDEAVKKSMDDAGAIVVIMTPEEETQLVKSLRTEPGDDKSYFQPRPNVIFEAGLALGMKEEKTIILQFGDIRIFSDILGKHIQKYKGKDKEMEFKNDLYHKLKLAGCDCDAGNDYFRLPIDYK